MKVQSRLDSAAFYDTQLNEGDDSLEVDSYTLSRFWTA